MTLWRNLIQTAYQGLKQWWRHPMRALQIRSDCSEVLVPMVSMDERHKDKILAHLLHLTPEDRVMRFGYPASDQQIGGYVDGMNFQRDHIYGIFNVALRIEALAHLSIETRQDGVILGEFGVSVRPKSRGKGLGTRLFERAMVHARHEGVSLFYIHALSENAPMLAIARHHGATMDREGSETEAYLRLPPADWESELEDWVIDQYGRINYSVKEQVKSFVEAVSQVQEIRQAVRDGRHRSAS